MRFRSPRADSTRRTPCGRGADRQPPIRWPRGRGVGERRLRPMTHDTERPRMAERVMHRLGLTSRSDLARLRAALDQQALDQRAAVDAGVSQAVLAARQHAEEMGNNIIETVMRAAREHAEAVGRVTLEQAVAIAREDARALSRGWATDVADRA